MQIMQVVTSAWEKWLVCTWSLLENDYELVILS